jgi:hypothetical protein
VAGGEKKSENCKEGSDGNQGIKETQEIKPRETKEIRGTDEQGALVLQGVIERILESLFQNEKGAAKESVDTNVSMKSETPQPIIGSNRAISILCYAPLLCAVLTQVHRIPELKNNRTGKILLSLEIFKAMCWVAFTSEADKRICTFPEELRYFCTVHLQSLVQLIVKNDGSIIQPQKLQLFLDFQRQQHADYVKSLLT